MYDNACEYFVNPEKGVVVCKIYDTDEGLLIDMARHNIGPGHEQAYLRTLLADSFIGKAVCKPEDTFDVETGKRIAYKKAVKKMVIAKKRTLLRCINDSIKSHEMLTSVALKLNTKYDNILKSCDEQILRLAGGPADTNKEGDN